MALTRPITFLEPDKRWGLESCHAGWFELTSWNVISESTQKFFKLRFYAVRSTMIQGKSAKEGDF